MTSRIFTTITPSTLQIPQLAWYFRKPNKAKHLQTNSQFVNHGHHQNPHGPQHVPNQKIENRRVEVLEFFLSPPNLKAFAA